MKESAARPPSGGWFLVLTAQNMRAASETCCTLSGLYNGDPSPVRPRKRLARPFLTTAQPVSGLSR